MRLKENKSREGKGARLYQGVSSAGTPSAQATSARMKALVIYSISLVFENITKYQDLYYILTQNHLNETLILQS